MFSLFNTKTKSLKSFTPLNPPKVGLYSCGPTVYQYAHIGNFRAYMTSDLLYRTLVQAGFDVTFVMNITDVGHLVSDQDTGEDKLEKSARKEGKTAWEVAEFYTNAFLSDYQSLHLSQPTILAKATDHIAEQIALIKKLEEKGFAYKITDGMYFDTAKFPDYGKLSTLDQIKEGARVEANDEKRNPRDFALWKFNQTGLKRDMEWESPWGVGFPGWHIECSAMSMEYLGETIDIHTGGVDHISIHHTNEIAQSEAATGKEFVRYWLHTAFMLVDGAKMSKSLGNTYTLTDLKTNGFMPMHLRYLYLQTNYRQEMNFTFDSLTAARNAYERLNTTLFSMPSGGNVNKVHYAKFIAAMQDDLNTSKALAAVWELLKSDIPEADKKATFIKIDEILGLGFVSQIVVSEAIPAEVLSLVQKRNEARKNQDFETSDALRAQIDKLGYTVSDGKDGPALVKKS